MNNNDNLVKDMMEEIKNDYINKYLEDLDNNIKRMLEIFGFKGDMNEVNEWLIEENYELLMDEENESCGHMRKCIYLVDKYYDTIVATFIVELDEEGYRISDVFYRIVER